MRIKIHASILDIPGPAWDALIDDNNPFLKHAFLAAMEKQGCIGSRFGWLPHPVAVYEGDTLVAAMPLYEKHNSYGEFVFDHAWAEAYQRAGIPYYPKLVAAIPYTPATGQRFLCDRGRETELFPVLLQTALQLAEKLGASGFHSLFQTPQEYEFTRQSLLTRHDCQFHWHNRDYQDFNDFLARLTSKKRKNIRQERRKVAARGIRFRVLDGYAASPGDWKDFNIFYQRTFENKWGMATFNQDFFAEVGRTMPDQVVLVLADQNDECIAGALMYRSDSTLYGRHWGCTEEVDHLHFETCYYQGIEYCIRHGIQRFEPGAQGEHKIARGFVPVLTHSSHWLKADLYQQAIAEFCDHERCAIAQYKQQLERSIPYKKEPLR